MAIERLAYSLEEAAHTLGVNVESVEELVNNGDLQVRRVGDQTVVLAWSLRAWLDAPPQTTTPSQVKPSRREEIRRPSPLTAARVKGEARQGRHWDGNGLYLLVTAQGTKRWVQRLTIRRRRTDLGLGGYPVVSLGEAREKALQNLKLTKAGEDPRITRRRSVVSFREAAEQVIALRRASWKNSRHHLQWTRTLETYVYPTLGDKPVDLIQGSDVMAVLTPIWTTIPETARRVHQRIAAVMDWAIAQEYRTRNPAGDAVTAVLPKMASTRSHHRAIHYTQVADALRRVYSSQAMMITKWSFEFLVLTAARSGEVLDASWEEMDFPNRMWVIPGARMKRDREHRVPLSDRVLDILNQVRDAAEQRRLVFPSPKGKRLSAETHRQLLADLRLTLPPTGSVQALEIGLLSAQTRLMP